MNPISLSLRCLLAAVFGLVGCRGQTDGPPLAPVSGVVLMNGQPLAGATVAFHPTGSTPGQGGAGESDASGKFTVGNRAPDGFVAGVPVGEYKITVSKQQGGTGQPLDENSVAPALVDGPETLPARYSDFTQSVLTERVPEGGRADLKIELRSR